MDYSRYNDFPKPVLKMANAYNGRTPLMDFDDYLAAAFIGYMRALNNKNYVENFDAYMWVTIRYEIINEIHRFRGTRRYRTRKPVDASYYITPEYIDIDLQLTDDTDIERKIIENETINMIRLLPERERFVIEEYFLNGKSHKDVCGKLSLKKSSVTNIKRNAIKLLKECIV